MATNNTPATASTAGKILDAINKAGGLLSLAIPAAGVAVPIITGIIALISKKMTASGEVEYTVVLTLGQGELDKVISLSTADQARINVELAKLGVPPLAGT